MTTTDYWTAAAAGTPPVVAPETDDHTINWRLMLAVGLNILAWAAILKTL